MKSRKYQSVSSECWSCGCDAFGNRETARTDALGHSFWTMFDPLGRIVSVDGDQYPLRMDYDTVGRKTRGFTTRDGGTTWDETRWEYDPASGVNTAKVYADGSRITYDYTDDGRKMRTTWARGVWRENAYNARGLVGGTTYSDATPAVSYTYTQSRQLASAALSDGTSCAYFYDDRLLCTNEVASGMAGDTLAVMRTYDDFRRPSTTSAVVTNIAHAAKTRLYDSENRVSGYALTNAAGRGISIALTYDGSYLTNTMYMLPNGSRFCVKLQREQGRRNLITRREYAFNGNSIYWYSTGFDLLGRPTNATDSVSLVRAWLYNRRSELAAAQIGANSYGYTYDTIGNRLCSSSNATINTYTANDLNQYTQVGRDTPIAPPVTFSYDADGNMTNDGRFTYTYDAENRLISACPITPAENSLAVENGYDHRHHRIRKTVKRYNGTEWQLAETHDFTYDGNNIVLERITFADGMTRTCEYFWGNDLSGTGHGAGGVGGLVAVSVDGEFFIPCYDHNGNVVCYVSESGTIAAQYVYDPYGNVIEQYGALADGFAIRFSTKYTDVETGLIPYLRRFYRPDHGRWLNRDPIEEEGGENLYAFCANAPQLYCDVNGCWAFIDNVVAFIGGAVVGVVCQAVADAVRGEVSGWETYLGAAAGGGVLGEVLLHAPAAAGAWKAIYGGAAAAVGNGVRQWCEVNVSGKNESFSASDFVIETSAGAAFAMAPFFKVKGVNAGRGSYLSVARTVSKKMANGSVSHVSMRTTIHSFVGVSTEYGMAYGAVQPIALDGLNLIGDKIQMFYREYIMINIVDKCGNKVEINYSGDFDTDAMIEVEADE